MKLSNVLKVFGAAALVAGLTPYRITRDEETGEKKVRALFWEATSGPNVEEGEEKALSVHLGFFSPVAQEDDEPHFFADELTVEYTREESAPEAEEPAEEEKAPAEEAEAPAAEKAEAAAEAAEEPEEAKDSEASEEN